MNFLNANGVRIPLELGSARRTNNRDKTERALSGAPLTSRFKTKESFSFKTTPLTLLESRVVKGLFLGYGEGCDCRLDLFTEKGVAELTGAVYDADLGTGSGRFLKAGIHPAYYLGNLAPNMENYSHGTFVVDFFYYYDENTAAPVGTLAQFYPRYDNTLQTYSSMGHVELTRDQLVCYTETLAGSPVSVAIGANEVRRGLNRVVVSWSFGGDLNMAINGRAAFPAKLTHGLNIIQVGVGERYPRDGTTEGSKVFTWADGRGNVPFNHRVGPWVTWPFTLQPDDMLRLSAAYTSSTAEPAYFMPAPYLNASGMLIGTGSMKCEGRVVSTDYLYADSVQLTLELDEI